MAILSRATTELKSGDWTLAIVLAAMAVECELVYLFMKWNRIDLMSVKNPTDADDEAWEKQWRDDVRTIAARFDKVSVQLTGQSFDTFLSQNTELLKTMHTACPASRSNFIRKTSSSKSSFASGIRSSTTGRSTFSSPTRRCALRPLQTSARFWPRWTLSVSTLWTRNTPPQPR